jgi:hypothetical protein
MYPNPALPAWQMAIMAVIPVMALTVWLVSIYLAARDTGGHEQAAAGSSPVGSAAAVRGPDDTAAIRPPGL